jgi:hypothetical protein
MVPRKQAGHMTCTRPQAERQILLATRASSTHDPKQTLRLSYLETASGVQELLCLERIALLAHQKAKEFVHAACSGRAKILYEMASHD